MIHINFLFYYYILIERSADYTKNSSGKVTYSKIFIGCAEVSRKLREVFLSGMFSNLNIIVHERFYLCRYMYPTKIMVSFDQFRWSNKRK